jgi:hypothetical protein
LPLLTEFVSSYSNKDNKSYSLSVFLNSLEVKLIKLENTDPAESGSGLSIEQEENLDLISIPYSPDKQIDLDPVYTIEYSGEKEYKDPVLNFTKRIRLQKRDSNGPDR